MKPNDDQEDALKRQEELARRQALEQEATNWAKAQQLRAYLAALKDMLITKHGEIQPGSQADTWLAWAYQHADRLDPLINGLKVRLLSSQIGMISCGERGNLRRLLAFLLIPFQHDQTYASPAV